ncbi:hypothetical protein C4J81_13370 [Deltaproteobacteria bacterium Smac51]|nr:hypothetical protein C4J81_13370 [Deltaproteobacteria bacterium Smac51]
MKRFAFARICGCVLAASILTTGCLNSEGEYNRLTEERDALTTELATARRENEILTAALNNITQEKERLEAALSPYQPAPAQAAGGDAAAAAASAGDAVVALAGDTDVIAQAADGAAGQTEGTAGQVTAGGKVHVAQRGDTLSNIATRYNTTLQELLALNPYLQRRNGYMVWENDNIQLP